MSVIYSSRICRNWSIFCSNFLLLSRALKLSHFTDLQATVAYVWNISTLYLQKKKKYIHIISLKNTQNVTSTFYKIKCKFY